MTTMEIIKVKALFTVLLLERIESTASTLHRAMEE